MANSNLISKLNAGTGEKWIHDASSLHGITPAAGDNASTFILQIADPSSVYATTVSLSMPKGVALKSDISAVMKFAGTASTYEDLPATTEADTGDTYVANGTFTIPAEKSGTTKAETVEPGDMMIMGEDGLWWVIQTNIDPAKYALKNHTHTLSISKDTGSTSINSLTSVGELPSFTYTDNSELLSFNAGKVPESEKQTVWTGYNSATAAAQVFNGATITLSGTFTPSGTISAPTFTGDEVTIKI